MVKQLSFWDFGENDVFTFELDSDGCVGTNVDTSHGVDYLLQKIDFQGEEKRRLYGVTSDSGGGGVGEGLVLELQYINRVIDHPLQATCSLHGLSLLLANPVTKLIGLGGLKQNNQFSYYLCVTTCRKNMN